MAMLAVNPASPSPTPKLLMEYTAIVVNKVYTTIDVKNPAMNASVKSLVQSFSRFIN